MAQRKVLIIKHGAIGDIVHTSIIAQAIKEAHPDWKIDFLVGESYVSLLDNHPYIDKVISWKHSQNKTFKGFLKLFIEIFKARYDYIFNPTNSLKTIILSTLTLPKKSIRRKNHGGLWVEDYFKMAKKAIPEVNMPNRLTLGISDIANEKIEKELEGYKKPFFVIAPGRNIDNIRQGRLWNIQKWNELTELLLNKYNGTVFVLGGKDEKENHKLLEKENVVIKSGDYSLSESNAMLSKADLMISGDTGPLHIASAFNVKTLALLGSTSPKQIKPYGENGNYISADFNCLYCWNKKCKLMEDGKIYTPCMEALSPKKVIEKIEEIF